MKNQAVNLSKFYPFDGLSDGKIVCAINTRHAGNMSLSYGDTKDVLINRKAFLESLGIDYLNLSCAKQAHGANVKFVKAEDKGKGALSYATAIADTDAFITDTTGLAVAIFTADCLPVFLYDPLTPAIGLAHAGWRSTKESICAKTVELMKRQFNTKVSTLYVSFGPAIRHCCYEVGPEFNDFFASGVIGKASRYYLDLIGVNKGQLLEAGVKEDNIFDAQVCTHCQTGNFFSYRKE